MQLRILHRCGDFFYNTGLSLLEVAQNQSQSSILVTQPLRPMYVGLLFILMFDALKEMLANLNRDAWTMYLFN